MDNTSPTFTSTETLTADMITKLRAEASAHGDFAMVECCDLAQGKGESGGPQTVHGARIMCADAISNARAIDDSKPFVRVVA